MAHSILSLDLGTSMGWAYIEDLKLFKSGVYPLAKEADHPGKKFNRLYDFLIKFNSVNEIFYEDVRFFANGYHSTRSWCGYLACLQMFTCATGIKSTCITTSAWKKAFCNKGNAKKIDVCAEAISKGWLNGKVGTELNHDEADAIGIADGILKLRNQALII